MTTKAPYVYQPYPSFRYHPTEAPVVVKTAEEDRALGPGWADAPVDPAAALPSVEALPSVDPAVAEGTLPAVAPVVEYTPIIPPAVEDAPIPVSTASVEVGWRVEEEESPARLVAKPKAVFNKRHK